MAIDTKSYRADGLSALRILICDDSEPDRKAIRFALDRSGLVCDYVGVSTINEAIEACQNLSFDCVFVDNMSSTGNGLEGVSILVGKWPYQPVIMITSHGDEKIAAEAIQLGAANYFRKSDLTGETIRRGIEDALTMSALRRAAMEHIKELESFASVLAHDLNAPVASLRLFAHTLEQDLSNSTADREELIALCREVVDAGVRTASMIDALHNYTKPDVEFELIKVDMNSVVEDAKENLAQMIRSRGADIACDKLPMVAGNAPFLVELMQNLFANAIKYCEGGTPAVHVSATPGPDDTWLILVSDNGIGIPEDQLKLVFEPLKRVSHETTYQGSGLGLAICRKIVERHGGTIHAMANKTGFGSSFVFTLPGARAENLTDSATSPSHQAALETENEDGVNPASPAPVTEEPEQVLSVRSNAGEKVLDGAGKQMAGTEYLATLAAQEELRSFNYGPAVVLSEGPPKLVIADDDPGIVRFLVERCKRMGFDVRGAQNGLQALALAKSFRPDALIMDINMPEADGLSVVARLFMPGNRPMEAIVVTSSSYAESATRCESLGAVYIRKGEDMFDHVRSSLLIMFPELDKGEEGTPATAPPPAARRTYPRVLVVGEDLTLSNFLASRLLKYDIETVTARDGVQAFHAAGSVEPSVIITKYAMPNGDARYLLNKLRGRPETASLPVFVVSDEAVDEVTQSRMQHESLNSSGPVQFFTQPIDSDAFFEALGKYCALAVNPNPFENLTYASSGEA